MHLIPLYEKIVIKIANKQEVTSESGLTYNKNMSISSNTTMIGKVVATGEGRLLANGQIVPMKVKVGDTILFNKINGESYNDGVEDYTILTEQNILAILKEDTNEDN